MENLGRKWSRTCLCILLVVVCLGTSFAFCTESKAQDEVVDTFYVLDEDGNPVTVEVTRGDLERNYETRGISLFSGARTGENTKAVDVGVVRFKSLDANNNGVVYYTEVDTGRQGYFNCMSAGDAAYIRTESDGSVICKLSGVVMKVPAGNVKEIVSYNSGQTVSYYRIVDGYLVHTHTYYSGSKLATSSIRVGYKPGYIQEGVKYYSYDGHYFYNDFTEMISDYRNGNYKNAVNMNTPYYNYYQYLSMHTTAPFTAEQYNAYVANNNKPDSVMLTTGNAFVATQNKYTVNALLMFGLAINESNWGRSDIAKKKNNLFGLSAVDSSPGASANTFKSLESCIQEFAYEWVHKGYLNGGDSRYRGPHFGDKHSGMNVKYASDPYWGEKAASRGYYFDLDKVDYGRYTIGIANSGKITCYKEADGQNKIYTTDASNGSKIYDYPVMVLEEVIGSNQEKYYKIVSDMSLKDDRSARNVHAVFDNSRDYVYVKSSDIQIVFDGSNDVVIPQPGTPSTPSAPENPGKTQAEVLSALKVTNSENFLTGFSVGSDVANLVAKVNALDSGIQVVIKKSDGTQITSGTIATGMQMTITTSGSTVTYTFVIRGDVNGDGKMSAIDYVMLRNYLDGKSSLAGAYLKSADTKSDGKVSALDYVLLRNHLDNKSTIVQ